jgi:hypothetical protein
MTTEPLPVLDLGGMGPIFADHLARVEIYGPVAHLVFAYEQREDYPEHSRRFAALACRLIVPVALLPRLARQLAEPVEQPPERGAQH